jgi:signal transduction histidine kinase
MQSIKYKILSAFLIIIAVLVVAETFFVALHFVTIKRYQDITDNMISEYQVWETSTSLISSFNDLVKYANDKSRMDKYNDKRAELLALLDKLDRNIVSPASQVSYLGLKNSVNIVLASCDSGVAAVFQGKFDDVTDDYNTANHQNLFVEQNTANLILAELQYTETLRTEIVKSQALIEILGILFFLIIVLGCIWYSLVFSRRLISPLIRLTKTAKAIEDGNLSAIVEKDLTGGTDEIASLANSFNTMVASLKDNIRQLRHYNETLIKTKKIVIDRETVINQLQEINRIKDEFMNIVTHELKTPLIPILGLSEVMAQQKQTLPPEFQNYVEIIHKEAEQLTGLIRQILTATRSQGTVNPVRETFKLDEFILAEQPALNEIAKRTDSQVEIKINGEGMEITSEKDKISQVLYNLVDNAVKYGPDKQSVSVALSKPDDKNIKVEVIDQGQGIPKESQDKLFLKFSQLEPSASRSREGMGLGLFICKQNIDHLGGRIGVESEAGQGADFYFILPLQPVAPSQGG